MFDRLLLLDKGGTTLYFGEIGQNASAIINYFEKQGAPKCQLHENPAEWMLRVTENMEASTDLQKLPVKEEWSRK